MIEDLRSESYHRALHTIDAAWSMDFDRMARLTSEAMTEGPAALYLLVGQLASAATLAIGPDLERRMFEAIAYRETSC